MQDKRALLEARRRLLLRRLYPDPDVSRPDWVEDELLRPAQVAMLFHVSRRTVSDWARAGKLSPILTPGGHRRFRYGDVRTLLEASVVVAVRE